MVAQTPSSSQGVTPSQRPPPARPSAPSHTSTANFEESNTSTTQHHRVPSFSVQKASDPPVEAVAPKSPGYLSPRGHHSRSSSVGSTSGRELPFEITEDELLPRILPEDTECKLRITFDVRDGKPNQRQFIFPSRKAWVAPPSYEQLYQQIIGQLSTHKKEILQNPQNLGIEVYRRHGSCLVVGARHEGPYSVIEDYDAEVLEQKAIQNICGFIHLYPFEPFRLEICLHFSSIRKTPQEPDGKYFRMVTNEINSKMSDNNFLDQEFLPRIHRDQLTSAHIIEQILVEEPRHLPERFGTDRKSLSRVIVEKGASILFIACVCRYMEIDLILHLIFEHKYNDASLPQLGDDACPKASCDSSVKNLLKQLKAFFARSIECDGKRHGLEDDEVMPIMNIPNCSTGSKETKLGEGSYGSVTAVTIDHSHHYLTGDPDRTFALKKFTDHGDFAASFVREFSMLERLFRKKHPHIVTHITSWTQRNVHYILYPRATRNLRIHMKSHRSPGRSGVNVAWLLRQFNGLASGLRSIHEMTEEAPGMNQNNHFVYGYHHDIKPENILLFEHVEGRNPVFKLSDFGAGKFHIMPKNHFNKPSQQSSQLRGTLSYYGPEYRGSKTRPFDIWALACVFFEATIWFALPHNHLAIFQSLREEESRQIFGWRDDFYWRECGNGSAKIELRPAVTEYFALLGGELAKGPDEIGRLLLGMLDLIMECFKIQPQERPKVGELCDRLDELQKKAETLFKNFEREVSTPSGSSGHSVKSNDGNVSESEDFFTRSPSQRNHTFPEDQASHRHR
ncbi:serine/threonine protein kinase [Capronia coronata CBS 617.96]|uniref:Serine/threonine protein kinase n=1 Tax=Capronia coronata CBS 617.96 TaxID=1182541 RepID=W9ZG23_9EURO|nr:serine/threonine protein kinase [Capronia coronata CBS 617.96]EXJ93444.1 serine/threonine protein kinase [Capronia coronata CBS 617.96]